MVAVAEVETFAGGEELAVFVGFESCGPWCCTADAFDVDNAGGQVAVFCRRDTAHHLHALYVVGGDRTHVYTSVHRRSDVGCIAAACSRYFCQVAVGVDGGAVDHKRGAE